MSLKDDIQNAMKENTTTLINTRLRNIADMTGMQDDEVRQKLKDMPFEKYVDLMRALRDVDAEAAKGILLGDMEEAYSGGGTLSPSEMRAQQSGQQSTGASKAQKTQAMQRLGSKNLGGATAAQSSDALDKASQGKPLTPVQRKAMAQQADSVSKLASDPRTATQFRNLLNKLDRK